MIDNPREYEVMATVESQHWWYRTLHAQVLEVLQRQPRRTKLRILDAGCGTGGLLQHLVASGEYQAHGFDLSPVAVAICRNQGLQVEQGDLLQYLQQQPNQCWDVLISNDTLYHLPETQRQVFFQQAYRVLQPGGCLMMNLPALAAFRGQHDRAVGVTHRFSREEVLTLIQGSGLRPITLRYWPVVLAPLIWCVRTWQRYTDRPQDQELPASDLKLHQGWLGHQLNELLFRLLQLERRCISRGPVGSSLFVVLQRPLN